MLVDVNVIVCKVLVLELLNKRLVGLEGHLSLLLITVTLLVLALQMKEACSVITAHRIAAGSTQNLMPHRLFKKVNAHFVHY